MSFATPKRVLDLMRERNELTDSMAAMRVRVKEIDLALAGELITEQRPYASFRYGPYAVRLRPKTTMTVIPDTEGEMMGWLQEAAPLRQLVAFNSLRIGQVKEVTGEKFRRIDPETGEIRQGWPAFRDAYLEVSEGETEVAVVPEARAPQFLQRLTEGEVLAR